VSVPKFWPYFKLGNFLLTKIELEERHLSAYLQGVITTQKALTTIKQNEVNQLASQIEGIRA